MKDSEQLDWVRVLPLLTDFSVLIQLAMTQKEIHTTSSMIIGYTTAMPLLSPKTNPSKGNSVARNANEEHGESNLKNQSLQLLPTALNSTKMPHGMLYVLPWTTGHPISRNSKNQMI